ncbi:helix-turn-helix domain-containing protein [Nocardia bhagyanarayanae]|uniref:helix-turn-helix domain-containing protein n=1 Tax=Nocardia bhagyanarayanae TaxID=1215925 RepID=UPI00163A4606
MSLAEREEISHGLAAGDSPRSIARGLGRAPSTISREVAERGGRFVHRAMPADRAAWAVRPKPTKLSRDPRSAALMAEKLVQRRSPQQIAGWLRRNQSPGGDTAMSVAHGSVSRVMQTDHHIIGYSRLAIGLGPGQDQSQVPGGRLSKRLPVSSIGVAR